MRYLLGEKDTSIANSDARIIILGSGGVDWRKIILILNNSNSQFKLKRKKRQCLL
jgi:hypothetical protein